jgi:archaetidylinositol phosphate synthase
MALEQLRKTWEKSLDPLLEKYDWISPSTITWIALPIGLLAAILSWFAPAGEEGGWWFLGSAALIGIAMVFDGLDGPIARKKGLVSRWGDYLDHTFDRVLDAVWLIGISASVYVDSLALGFASAFFTLLGSYMGTQAQAVSGTRNYGGFSRADRTVLIILMLTIMGIVTLADYPFNDRYDTNESLVFGSLCESFWRIVDILPPFFPSTKGDSSYGCKSSTSTTKCEKRRRMNEKVQRWPNRTF